MKEKYYIVFEEYERRMIINSLNELRNRLIADGRYTEAVDEILLKIINAKKKKFTRTETIRPAFFGLQTLPAEYAELSPLTGPLPKSTISPII